MVTRKTKKTDPDGRKRGGIAGIDTEVLVRMRIETGDDADDLILDREAPGGVMTQAMSAHTEAEEGIVPTVGALGTEIVATTMEAAEDIATSVRLGARTGTAVADMRIGGGLAGKPIDPIATRRLRRTTGALIARMINVADAEGIIVQAGDRLHQNGRTADDKTLAKGRNKASHETDIATTAPVNQTRATQTRRLSAHKSSPPCSPQPQISTRTGCSASQP